MELLVENAMGKRARWLPVLAVPVLLGMTGMPAFARGEAGGSRSSGFAARAPIHAGTGRSRITFHRLGSRNNLLLGRGAQSRYNLPFGLWPDLPYWQYWQSVPTDAASGDDAPANPYVIVISAQPPSAPQRTPVAASGSVSVGGCYPIPNGYHCDSPQHGAAP
ncbi:MAG TPA: hypothetical protein VK741_25110 [Acetobacteraceae bacterium]|nr:hypothetical protein [Acetobacteraceae bacterium]